jgi:alpha-beta hydrolase superfamily lysophospholipase
MVYGFDANVVNFWRFWNNASTEDVDSYGGSLAVSIRDCRPAVDNETALAVAPTRPIYFIAHSLGGLVT